MSMSALAPQIHPTAVVDPRAQLAEGVTVGPYAVIGPKVRLGVGTRIGPHVVLDGWVTMGADNQVFPGACIGLEPQDLKYTGDETEVAIGDGNRIRECVTINRATAEGESTVLGSHNFLADGVAVHNSLEQDADMVVLIHREDAYDKDSSRLGEADLIVAKHRNGPTDTITVAFQGHYSRFVDMARE